MGGRKDRYDHSLSICTWRSLVVTWYLFSFGISIRWRCWIVKGIFRGIKVLGFHIWSAEGSWLSEFRRATLMLILSMSFNLDPSSCVTPLLKWMSKLLIAPLISYNLILTKEPHLFNLLLLHVICREIMIVVWLSLKSILGFEYNRLIIVWVEFLEGIGIRRSLFFFENWLRLCRKLCLCQGGCTARWALLKLVSRACNSCIETTKLFALVIG